MKNNGLILMYSEALMSFSDDNIYQEVCVLLNLFQCNHQLFKFLSCPVIGIDSKKTVIQSIKPLVNKLLVNFLLVLVKNNRFNLIISIFKNYIRLMRALKKEVEIEVTSVAPLTDDEKQNIINELELIYGKVLSLDNKIDKSILGGFIIRVGFDIIDASFSSYLKRMVEASKVSIRSMN